MAEDLPVAATRSTLPAQRSARPAPDGADLPVAARLPSAGSSDGSGGLADPERLRSLQQVCVGAEPDAAFDRFAGLVKRLLDVPVALVSLVDGQRQFFPGQVGLADPWAGKRETPLTHSFCQYVVIEQRPKVYSDARVHPQVRDNLAIPDLGVVAYAGMPLTDNDGRVLGSLCAIDTEARDWTPNELEVLADLAEACSSELRLRLAREVAEEARRYAESAHDQLAMLTELTEALAGTLDGRAALDLLVQAVTPRLADWCVVAAADGRHVASAHRDPAREADLRRFTELADADGPEADEIAARLGSTSVLVVPIVAPVTGRPDDAQTDLVAPIVASTTSRPETAQPDRLTPVDAPAAGRSDPAQPGLVPPIVTPTTGRPDPVRPDLVPPIVTPTTGRPDPVRPDLVPPIVAPATSRSGTAVTGRFGASVSGRSDAARPGRAADDLASAVTGDATPGAPVTTGLLGTITLVNGPERPAFTERDERTARDVGRRAGLALDTIRLYGRQRHVAEVLQHSMLTDLPDISGIELHARYQAAQDGVAVGGDWYDAFAQPDGSVIVAVGDVSGHDVEAAAAMGQLRNLVRGDAYGRDDPPGILLAHLDRALHGLGIMTAATGVLARLRPDGPGWFGLEFANAGHPPPLVRLPDGRVEIWWETPEPLLGLLPRITRSTHRRRIPAGSTLLLYTDGLVEEPATLIDEGIERISQVLRTAAAGTPGDELCARLLASVRRRADDIALLLIKVGQPADD